MSYYLIVLILLINTTLAVHYNSYKNNYKSYSYSQPIPYRNYNYGPSSPPSYSPAPSPPATPKPQYYPVCAFFRGVWKTFDSIQQLKYQQKLGYSK